MASFSDTGSYSGHLRLRSQVTVDDPGPSTSSVDVRLRVWVGTDGWDINDGQRVGFSGWKSGGQDFQNDLSSGEKLVIDRTWSHSVGSTRVAHNFSATLSGNDATGSSPSTRVDFTVEGRPGSAPGICRGLKVGQITAHGAHFDWSPPQNTGGLLTRGYQLHYRRDVDSSYEVIDVDVTQRTITSSLDRNTLYRWRVRAYNSAGLGDLNDGDQFRTLSEKPSVGLPVEVTDLTSTSAKINWAIGDNGGSSTDKSDVIVSTSSDRDNTSARVHDAESTVVLSRVVTGLTRSTKYYYWIRIWNGTYWSDWTQTRDFTTLKTAPTDRPTLTVGVVNTTSASMSWVFSGDTGGSAITGYDWQVSLADNFSSLFDSGSTTGATSRTQTGLTPATQYFFRVRAKNGEGDGPWSAIRSLVAPQGIKRWNGTAWVAAPLYYWDGTDWSVPASIKVWNGSSWVEAN